MNKVYGIYCKDYPNVIKFYEEDINTFEGLINVFKLMSGERGYLTKAGLDYLKFAYTFEDLQKAARLTNFIDPEDVLYELELNTLNSIRNVIVWNQDDYLKSLSGVIDTKFNETTRIIKVFDKFDFTPTIFKQVIENYIYNINNNLNNNDYFLLVWELLLNYTNLTGEVSKYDYDLNDIYDTLFDYSLEHHERVSKTYDYIVKYIEEENKPLYEKTVPVKVMEKILENLDKDQNTEGINPLVYESFMNKLCNMDNILGLEIKTYAYYGGNKFVKEDYRISEQCLLRLLTLNYNDNYANTLGYIYYYGRVNSGIPEYEKARDYFTMAAIAGNIEASYKLGDMYKNGYGVEKNELVAKTCYENLYRKALFEFYDYPKYANLADVALRIGSFYEKEETAFHAASMYLIALMAINIRNNRFDSGVKRTITNNLLDLYSKYESSIKSSFNIFNALFYFGKLEATIDNNTIEFYSENERILVDVSQMNCCFTDTILIHYDGKIIKGFKDNTLIDDIEYDRDGNLILLYEEKVVGKVHCDSLEIIFDEPLIKNIDNQEEYNVAICQYNKGYGKKYTFIVDEQGDIDDSWIIVENEKEVFPIEFKVMKEFELPCDLSVIKHIKKNIVC